MDRREQTLESIRPTHRGIEIGPYFNPLVPKSAGYNSLALDVFDAATLRRHAAVDTNIPKDAIGRIEEVDLVGSSTDIAEIVAPKYGLGTFDYVVSSHNIEHIPDPIRFLQGCEKVLRPGGIISLAAPDRRCCYDYFRPHSTLGEWLEAYFAKRERSSQTQLFDQSTLYSRCLRDGQMLFAFSLADNPDGIVPSETLREAFDSWVAFNRTPDEVYRDTHCWTFTPASFELLIEDLRFLGLLRLEIVRITPPNFHEFYAQLRNPTRDNAPATDTSAFYAKRKQILHKMVAEAAENAPSPRGGDLITTDKIAQLREELRLARIWGADLNRRIERMKSSFGWRLTSPLREIKRFLVRFFG